jgi:predicted oxidoreductase
MPRTTRRGFLNVVALAGIGGQTLLRSGSIKAAVEDAKGSTDAWPRMDYRRLGRTGFNGSRLVFGCGAALSSGQSKDLLAPAADAGVNVFDVGYSDYYGEAEHHLGVFLKGRRDKAFLISKATPQVEMDADEVLSAEKRRDAAANWSSWLDRSLKGLGVEQVDAYYIMAAKNVSLIESDEMYQAFETARDAGKVKYLGLSTHENAQNVLLAAAKSGRFDLAQIAITPGGWYDWETRALLDGTPPLIQLQPVLAAAHEAGMGLIGMKAGRYLAGRRFLGWGNPDAYDGYYDPQLLSAKLTAFQRSYAYVLAHGLDAVNADSQTWQHLKENFAAAAMSKSYFT